MDILATSDWQEVWAALQQKRQRPADAQHWNDRAADYARSVGNSSYTQRFLELLRIQPGQSVLDMGCGPGALCIPLAKAGNEVLACDFAQAMLDEVQRRAQQEGLANLRTKLLAWEDDWVTKGVAPQQADVVIASRSIAVQDLHAALSKLNQTARKKVALTIGTADQPRSNRRIIEAVGRKAEAAYDLPVCLNMLFAMGLNPELRYISSHKTDRFASFDDAFAACRQMLHNPTPHEEELLAAYLQEHLVVEGKATALEKPFVFTAPRLITWAFISWKPRNPRE
ncbi:MAG: methyltransferase domain-containing protein [Coriobacteriales bacterium]|nr:methyltransferase domain-containing protein [Coriobacteriales bacterium]